MRGDGCRSGGDAFDVFDRLIANNVVVDKVVMSTDMQMWDSTGARTLWILLTNLKFRRLWKK